MASGSVDLVFSNFVIQWVEDKPAMMAEVVRCLKPGGRFAFVVVGALSLFTTRVSRLAGPAGEALISRIETIPEAACRTLLDDAGLSIASARTLQNPQYFADLETYLTWWEATTRGAFSRDAVSASDMAQLEREFAGGLEVRLSDIVEVLAFKAG